MPFSFEVRSQEVQGPFICINNWPEILTVSKIDLKMKTGDSCPDWKEVPVALGCIVFVFLLLFTHSQLTRNPSRAAHWADVTLSNIFLQILTKIFSIGRMAHYILWGKQTFSQTKVFKYTASLGLFRPSNTEIHNQLQACIGLDIFFKNYFY